MIIDDFVFLVGGVETRIGSFVHLASFSSYLGRGSLVIEDFVSVSSGARIYTGIDDFSGESLVGPGVPEPGAGPRERSHVSASLPSSAPTRWYFPESPSGRAARSAHCPS